MPRYQKPSILEEVNVTYSSSSKSIASREPKVVRVPGTPFEVGEDGIVRLPEKLLAALLDNAQ